MATAAIFGILFASIVILFYVGLVLRSPFEQFEQVMEQIPLLGILLGGWVFTAFLSSILWAEEKIHHRPPRGLFSVDGTIRFRRLGMAALVWLGLRIVSTLITYPFATAAYDWAGNLREWAAFLPFLAIFALLFAITWLLFLSYLMRGLSLIVSNPLILVGIFSLIGGILVALDTRINAPFSFLFAFTESFLILFLILKDEGIELAIGLQAADLTYRSVFMIGEEANRFAPGLLILDLDILASPGFMILSLGLLLVRWGIFYYWFRGRSQHLQRLL